ncbi:hypothetical protein BGZ68_010237 [Mortierella alpina]|nr:hypothetical protein BGZ68_010237 [Mortierella alpina]
MASLCSLLRLNCKAYERATAALAIPEILELILSFLTPRRLRTVASLVCKQWLAISKRITPPVPVLWPLCSSQQLSEKALQLIPTSQIVRVQAPLRIAGRYPSPQAQIDSWIGMTNSLEVLHRGGGFACVKEFWFAGDYKTSSHLKPHLPQLLSLLGGITTLRLDRFVAVVEMELLVNIMEACPGLLHLVLEPTDYSKLVQPRVQQVERSTEYRIPFMKNLRALTVYGLVGTLKEIKDVVNACPGLTTLRINSARILHAVSAQLDTESDLSETNTLGAERARFMVSLLGSNLKLSDFHFSIMMERLSEQDLITLFGFFQDRTHWSFSDYDVGSVLLESILLRTKPCINADFAHSRLTTLELLPSSGSSDIKGSFLHLILCFCPHLQHLRAPHVAYYHSDFDVNDLLTHAGHYRRTKERKPMLDNLDYIDNHFSCPATPRQRRVWVCRGLRTLHFAVAGFSADTPSIPNALTMFGYLSRVCPNLEDLYVRRWLLSLSFMGGLCLLTRLKNLKRLKISTHSYHGLTPSSIEWIRRYPSTEEILKRPIAAYLAKQSIGAPTVEGPDADSIGNFQDKVCDLHEREKATQDEEQLDLRMVGRSEDLVQWMKDRSSGQEPSWPVLDSFLIEYENENIQMDDRGKVVKFVKSVRPEIDIRFLYKKYHG